MTSLAPGCASGVAGIGTIEVRPRTSLRLAAELGTSVYAHPPADVRTQGFPCGEGRNGLYAIANGLPVAISGSTFEHVGVHTQQSVGPHASTLWEDFGNEARLLLRLQRAIAHSVNARPTPRAVERAKEVIAAICRTRRSPSRIAVTRSQGISVAFAEGRRFAIFDCDCEGDLILTLTDRSSDTEANAYAVAPEDVEQHLDQVKKFLAA